MKELFSYRVETTAWPLIDSYETEDDFVFEIDLPGMSLDEVSITVVGDLLVIEALRRSLKDASRVNYICMERNVKGFRRVVRIPVPVNTAAAEATYAHGVVTVTFPKVKSRTITIAIQRR
ncbi:MAG: Hsp20/alpha crystallin family protein [Nitrospirota bacterium]